MKFIDSEYKKIKKVMLYCPNKKINNISNIKHALHLNTIDHVKITEEFNAIIDTFRSLNVEVMLIDDTKIGHTSDDYLLNMMYCRDIFFMTPRGAILSQMAYDVRKEETLYAERTLKRNNIPVIAQISSDASFEGADALWIREDLVIIGVGNRTDNKALQEISNILNKENIKCIKLPVNQNVTQHILGTLQIVDKDLAFVRVDIIDPSIIDFLRNNCFNVVPIKENNEIKKKQAMNIVTVAPRKIIMTADCPVTRAIYEKNGVEVFAELKIDELINGAGGLACATNIISREI